MENLYIKEKRLETALEKLKDLSNSNYGGKDDINNLNVEKNQLQSEKNEIERKYNQLLSEYDNLKKSLIRCRRRVQKNRKYKISLTKT